MNCPGSKAWPHTGGDILLPERRAEQSKGDSAALSVTRKAGRERLTRGETHVKDGQARHVMFG